MYVILCWTVLKFSLAQYFSQCCQKKTNSKPKNNTFNLILHIRFHFWTKVTYAIRPNHSFLPAFYNPLPPPSKRMNNFEELMKNCGRSIRFTKVQEQFLYRSFAVGLRHIWFVFCRHCCVPRLYNERIRSIIECTTVADLLSIRDRKLGTSLPRPPLCKFLWIYLQTQVEQRKIPTGWNTPMILLIKFVDGTQNISIRCFSNSYFP